MSQRLILHRWAVWDDSRAALAGRWATLVSDDGRGHDDSATVIADGPEPEAERTVRMPAAMARALANEAMDTAAAARELGLTPGRTRRLARSRGVGQVERGQWVFSPADIDAMRDRRPGRPYSQRKDWRPVVSGLHVAGRSGAPLPGVSLHHRPVIRDSQAIAYYRGDTIPNSG